MTGWVEVLIICGPCMSDHCQRCEGDCPCEHPPLDDSGAREQS